MKILLFKKYLVIISLLFLSSCATYQAKYHSKNDTFSFNQKPPSSEKIVHTFYLIGDAGNAQENEQLTHFNLLKEELSIADKNSTVLFLGDNLYEKGMPKKEHATRKISEHRLDAQIELVKNFNGQPIFIPGNHEYYSDGIKGLKREEEYIIKNLKNKHSFLPKDGCPLKKVDISENLVLIIVDSQWYLEDWDKNSTMNDDCEIKTKERFFDEFESLITHLPEMGLQRISWKHYAKTQQLLVKQFSDFKSADAQFDFNLVTGDTEQRLGQLCFLVCQAFESDINYSLKLPNKLITTNSGKLHHQRCLQALSQVGDDNE